MPGASGPFARWTAPECPFTVDFVPDVLDDIRLAVVDAFFSLPRGGAEIGGLLLGRRQGNGIAITGWQALACEHAFGPSFNLSETDRKRLAEMIAAAQATPGAQPVGWYHSHTRSEIFLSEADQEIHRQFFPEPWQVALVLRPHTFNPTRAGFFFRGAGGAMRGDASYLEFVVDAMPTSPVPARESAAPAEAARPRAEAAAVSESGPVIDVARVVEEKAPAPVEPARPPVPDPPPPAFLTATEPAPSRIWVAVAGVLLGVAAGTGAYLTRQSWFPPLAALVQTAGPVTHASLGLRALDRDGELEIQWDGNAAGVRSGRSGILLITDGSLARSLPLDSAHLRTGSLTYQRQSERVDITLTLDQPNGQKMIEAATFLGQAPAPPVAADAKPAARQDRDAMVQENRKLRVRIAAQDARIAELEKSLEVERRLLELRSRMQNQSTGGK